MDFLSNLIEKPVSGEWGNDGDKTPVIRSTNFTMDGILDLSNVKFRDIDDSKIAKKKLQRGDILIEKSGGSLDQPVGRVVFFDEEGVFLFSNFTSALRPKQDKVFPKYLNYMLLSAYKGNITSYFQNRTTGIINLQLTRYVDELQIPLPSLATQRKVAEALDKADAIRKRSQQILNKYDQLAQSVFLEMFGDPVKNEKGWGAEALGKICGVGSSKRVFVEELVNQGIPFYRGTEVGHLGNGEEIKPSLFITEEHYKVLSAHTGIPQIGDLLMPSICPDGRIWRVNNSKPFYFKDGRVLWIKVNSEEINATYLHAFLKNIFQLNYSSIASGTTFAELKIFALKKIKVIIPSDSLQNKFASIIEQIEKQKAQTQAELARAETLYQSLLQRAFTGDLFPETLEEPTNLN
ncbi:restriction endonuclease subunit S [Roseivirga echinicomitans]